MDRKSLGRHVIVRPLDAAPWGPVYEAIDTVRQSKVLLHCVQLHDLSPKAAGEFIERLRGEASAAARLIHPNIAAVLDSGHDDGTAFLVTQHVDGESLKARLAREGGPMAPALALALMRDLLAALGHAHGRGLVHQGVRPANLLLAIGRTRLTGFGMACIQMSEATTGAKLGALSVGTRFMSPEQVQGQPLDLRSDVFSAGVILYEMLTGTRPFDASNPFAVIQRILTDAPPAPTQLVPALPIELDAVLAKALAKDREARFASVHEFQQALEGFPLTPRAPAPPAVAAPQQSTIALELELEYWKDIKESEEAEDFVGYLKTFPGGHFAPLAERRLRKMGQGAA